MSGTGKTAVLHRLRHQSFDIVDTDLGPWKRWDEDTHDWLWDEPMMHALLAAHRDRPLAVSGCVPNQGRFYAAFDKVILLTAPLSAMRARVVQRRDNPFGQSDDEWDKVAQDTAMVVPLLRQGCDLEINTDRPLDDVVAQVLAAVRA